MLRGGSSDTRRGRLPPPGAGSFGNDDPLSEGGNYADSGADRLRKAADASRYVDVPPEQV